MPESNGQEHFKQWVKLELGIQVSIFPRGFTQ